MQVCNCRTWLLQHTYSGMTGVQWKNILNESNGGGRGYLSKVNRVLCTIYTGSHDVLLYPQFFIGWLSPLLENKLPLDSMKGENCEMLSPKQLVGCLMSVAKHVSEEIRSCLHCQTGGFPVYYGKLRLPLKNNWINSYMSEIIFTFCGSFLNVPGYIIENRIFFYII